MLHSTQTTKKHTGNLILRFGMAGLLAAGLFFSAPYSAAAECCSRPAECGRTPR